MTKTASRITNDHALKALQAAEAAVKAANLEPASPITATDPTDKGTAAVPAGETTGVLPASHRPTNTDGNGGFTTPASSQRHSEGGEGTPSAPQRRPDEGSPLNKGAAVIDFKAVVAKAAAAAGPAPVAAPAAAPAPAPAKAAAGNPNAVASDFESVSFYKLAHEMLQDEEGRNLAQGWIRRKFAKAEAADLFAKAASFSDAHAKREKVAAAEFAVIKQAWHSIPTKYAGLRDTVFKAHQKQLAGIADGVEKFAKEAGLTAGQAQELFQLERIAYIKGANDMQAGLEAVGEGEAPMPAGPEAAPEASPEDMLLVIDQLMQEGKIDEATAQALLQALGLVPGDEGGAPAGDPAAAGAPVEGDPAAGGAPVEEVPAEPAADEGAPAEDEGEKAAALADELFATLNK